MFLNSFNYFRGVAILYIVAGHTYWVARWNTDQAWERLIANLISGGTLLFVFISGFLFHHVFYPRFQYGTFLKKKVQNVWVPYLILSILPILYILVKQFGPFDYYYFNKAPGLWNQYFRPALLYVWTGNAVPPFWYIPFIMLTFLMSPLHKKYIETDWKTQTIVLLILISISVLLHRPVQNLSPLHAVGYYSSGYFLGIYCSIHREHVYRILKGKEWVLLIFILGLAAFQAWKFPYISLFAKPAFKWGYPDIQYLQKVILCFFFMVFLHRFENVRITILNKVAEASFAIYFLHSFIIEFTGMVIRKNGLTFSGSVLTWIVFTAAVAYATYAAAWLVKRCIKGGKSRYIIGW